MKKRVQTWLDEAKWDLENARILFDNKRYNTAIFNSQQASEKAVKALLFSCNLNGWGHSITTLLKKYKIKKKRPINTIEKEARNLDVVYFPTRSPDALPGIAPHDAYDKEDAVNSIKQAEKIFKFVENELVYFKQKLEVDEN